MAEIQEMTGFQSPCAEYAEDRLSLDQRFLSNPPAMFPLKVGSDSKLFELKKGDHLIVDRSLEPKQGDLVVAVVSNNFLIAKFSRAPDGTCWLLPFNKKVGDVEAEEDFIWGVIASVHRRMIK